MNKNKPEILIELEKFTELNKNFTIDDMKEWTEKLRRQINDEIDEEIKCTHDPQRIIHDIHDFENYKEGL